MDAESEPRRAAALHLAPLQASDRPRVEAILRATSVFRDEEVQVALELFDEAYGEGASADPARMDDLVELTVYLNAAWSAHQALHWVEREGP